ncbi:GNAT family N-acetyltransferase [Utexia brackfieldae]|uniref:tRNA(Met) cytidine acetyltransferase TmcA n=1 Tax=Utexia brackfieldae TaxID=3074108 RepID=UPI00370CFF9A
MLFNQNDLLRHLMVIQGVQSQVYNAAFQVIAQHDGDWVFITDNQQIESGLSPKKSKSLLGHEFKHAIFDATSGFHLEAFAILAGTLKKGSMLLLLLPEQPLIEPDIDSLRWYESETPIATPNFIQHLFNTLARHQVPIYLAPFHFKLDNCVQSDDCLAQNRDNRHQSGQYRPTQEQANILAQLEHITQNVATITAKRGRGKSALAGWFTHSHTCWICVPNKDSVTTLKSFASPQTLFWAPDHLLAALTQTTQKPEWIIVDEAAMIPVAILKQIIAKSCRILLITTTEGYEGTGQGFLLKLLPELSDAAHFHLNAPIRWQFNDPLEQFMNDLLLEDPRPSPSIIKNINLDSMTLNLVNPTDLACDCVKFNSVYGLLKSAHYRTTPVDLRRLFDAPNLVIVEAQIKQQTAGVILSIKEGLLTDELSQAIWLGQRRPKGNLVAQALVAFAGQPQAATLRSLRINRIAVEANMRRQGIGRSLVEHQLNLAKNARYDFVSVSFAYDDKIAAFWQACGFSLVHIGSRQEASSGCYAAMAIKALSLSGAELQQRLKDQFARNWFWLQDKINVALPIQINHHQSLTDDDWHELAGFAFAHRPYEACFPVICRLKQSLPSLFAHESKRHDQGEIARLPDDLLDTDIHTTGRKQVIQTLRKAVQTIFHQLGRSVTL